MARDIILDLKHEILDLSEVIAAVVLRGQCPADDEMPRRFAEREFGAKWLAHQVECGRIIGRRRGTHPNSPIIFSRAELLALKEADRRGTVVIEAKAAKAATQEVKRRGRPKKTILNLQP